MKVLLPVRPNGSTGWVQAQRRHRLARTRTGSTSTSATTTQGVQGRPALPAGHGRDRRRPSTPTPIGKFYIRVLLQPPDPNTVYGPYAYGLSSHSEALNEFNGGDAEVGIHGNNDASVLGEGRQPRAASGWTTPRSRSSPRCSRSARRSRSTRDRRGVRAVAALSPRSRSLAVASSRSSPFTRRPTPAGTRPPAARPVAALAKLFRDELKPLGLRVTRGLLQNLDTYEQDPEGHPPRALRRADQSSTYATRRLREELREAHARASCRWCSTGGRASRASTSARSRSNDPRDAPPPVTQIFVSRDRARPRRQAGSRRRSSSCSPPRPRTAPAQCRLLRLLRRRHPSRTRVPDGGRRRGLPHLARVLGY